MYARNDYFDEEKLLQNGDIFSPLHQPTSTEGLAKSYDCARV